MAKVLRSVPWILGLVVVFAAGSGLTQGNIDAGKTPGQMFSETCSACHKRASDLKRGANASFLRQHYMSGTQEAAAMAAYLAGGAAAANDRKERLKAQQEKANAAKGKTEQAKLDPKGKVQPATKGRPGKAGETPMPDATQRAEAPAVPKLEPFEE